MFLIETAERYPKARRFLESWRVIVRSAQWRNLDDVRKTYASADAVKVQSGRTVVIFNVCGNDYRLIAAMHYNRQLVFTLRFYTHAEYSKERWKEEL